MFNNYLDVFISINTISEYVVHFFKNVKYKFKLFMQ